MYVFWINSNKQLHWLTAPLTSSNMLIVMKLSKELSWLFLAYLFRVNQSSFNSHVILKLLHTFMYNALSCIYSKEMTHTVVWMVKLWPTLVLAAIQLEVSLSSSHFLIHFLSHLHWTGSCQFSPHAKLQEIHVSINHFVIQVIHFLKDFTVMWTKLGLKITCNIKFVCTPLCIISIIDIKNYHLMLHWTCSKSFI